MGLGHTTIPSLGDQPVPPEPEGALISLEYPGSLTRGGIDAD